ncbi:hypothetical protein EB796_008828 [Bugula neritina]|uniref:Uncharacterized protein n=1 Tax=Bugula neritina TaxID=10212 RepID=A0A7J7K4I0_BUGNE|nr:hypothetical protein EB796_008828 [Bugula neritina]
MTMQVCNTLNIAFVETDMADMEGLMKQVAIRRAKLIVMRCVAVLWLIQCTLYLNAHAMSLRLLMEIYDYIQ